MSKSDDTLAADLARAKSILTDGALWTLTDGYGLLARFVQYIETHFRPDHNGECLNCDEPLDGHDVFTELARLDAEVARLQRWEDAVLDACVVDWIYTRAHDTDPRQAVNDLLAWQQQIALDPTVSIDAKALHDRIGAQAAEIAELRAQLDEVEAESDEAGRGWSMSVAVNQALIAEHDAQAAEIERLHETVTHHTVHIDELRAEVERLREVVASHEEELGDLQAKYIPAVTELGRLRAEVESDEDTMRLDREARDAAIAEARRLRALVDAVGEKVCEVALRVARLSDHE